MFAGLALCLSTLALAGDRPTSRVPSPDRDASSAPASTAPAAPTTAPAASTTASTAPAAVAGPQASPESVPQPDPAAILAAAVPAETETGPGCLKVVSVTKTAEITQDALYNAFNARLVNACGQPVISYAGALSFQSQKGPISQSLGVYSAGGVPLEGTQATWRFRVLQTAEDIWLNTAPTSSMSWSWTTGYVLLADGTVYRGEEKIPDARR